MAIDYNTGISSLETGAPDIKYTGDEGPKSPQEEMQIAGREYNRVLEILEKVRENIPLSDEEKMELQGLIKTLTAKGIPVEQLIGQEQGREGIQMASAADPMLQEEAVAGMATGGREGYKDGEMVTVPKHWQSAPDHPKTELAYITDAEKDLLVKKDLHNSLKDGPNVGPGGVMSLNGDYSDMMSGITGADISAAERGEGPRGAMDQGRADELRAAVVAAGAKPKKGGENENVKKNVKEIAETFDAEIPEEAEKKPFVIKTLWDKVFKQKTANAKKYISYLKSQGATIPDWLREIEEGDDKYLTEEQEQLLNYGWGPEEYVADPFLQEALDIDPHAVGPMSYGDWKASQGNFGIISHGDLGNLVNLKNPGTVINLKTGLPFTDFEWDQHKRASGQMPPGEGGPEYRPVLPGTGVPIDPDDPDDPDDPTIPDDRIRFAQNIDPGHQAILKNIYGGTLPTQFAADGGRIGYAGGGIADLRQGYFLGKLVKSITKPFKGITRGIKKFAKSPAGKMAILGALGYGTGMFGSGAGGNFLTKMIGQKGLPGVMSTTPWGAKSMTPGTKGSTGWLGKLLLKGGADKWSMENISPWKSIGLMSMLPFLQGKEDDDMDVYKNWLAEKKAADEYWIPRFDESNFRRIYSAADGGRIGYAKGGNGDDDSMVGISMSIEERWERIKKMLQQLEDIKSGKTTDPKYDPEDKAQGGRIGYAGGGYNDDEEDHRMAALSAMYGLRRNAQEGGLMDLGGMEKDYRNEGGFVPIGGQERADDVPARLSKNEFVFTADAVRAAGDGDIDKGAEVMENVMENLEKGGNISEESQGLEGARDMFATSQRLEGVL